MIIVSRPFRIELHRAVNESGIGQNNGAAGGFCFADRIEFVGAVDSRKDVSDFRLNGTPVPAVLQFRHSVDPERFRFPGSCGTAENIFIIHIGYSSGGDFFAVAVLVPVSEKHGSPYSGSAGIGLDRADIITVIIRILGQSKTALFQIGCAGDCLSFCSCFVESRK